MKLDVLPAGLFTPLRLAVQDGIASFGKFAWSSNHDTQPFSYWYFNLCGTADANTENMETKLLGGSRSRGLALEAWNLVKSLHGGEGCTLLRAIAYVHEWNAAPYPHISIGGREGDKTVVLYLNKQWDEAWQGETVLRATKDTEEQMITPAPNRILSFDADRLHEVRPAVGTYAARASLVFRLTSVANVQKALVAPASLDAPVLRTGASRMTGGELRPRGQR